MTRITLIKLTWNSSDTPRDRCDECWLVVVTELQVSIRLRCGTTCPTCSEPRSAASPKTGVDSMGYAGLFKRRKRVWRDRTA